MGVRIGCAGISPADSVDTHLLWQVQPIGGSGKLGPFDLDVITTLPRPLLLGVVGIVLIGAVFFATRKPGGSTSTPATPAPAAAPSTENPGASPQATKATPSSPPAKGGTAQKPAAKTSERGLPAPVQKALDAKKVVVILFWNRRAVDDRSVKSAVDRLPRHHGKVAVFTDGVRHLSRYTRITSATSVSQTPALVFVNRKGQAELQTGYLDYQTIQQYVRNALGH
jgi:hypothetical protein